jgi:predicted RNA-binding protein with PIN domain
MKIQINLQVKDGAWSMPYPRQDGETDQEYAERYARTLDHIHLSAVVVVTQDGEADKSARYETSRFDRSILASERLRFQGQVLRTVARNTPEWVS